MPTYGQYDVPTSDIMVNLGVGQPDNRKLPLNLIKKGMQQFIDKEDNAEVLQYGDIPGYRRFREKLAKWLSDNSYDNLPEDDEFFNDFKENDGLNIGEDELFITNGITHALHMIMTAYMFQEDAILVEDPSYFIMINIFKEFGLDVISIPMEEDGIDVDIVEEKLEILCKDQDKVFLYTIPINHNPTGITLSNEKRKRLAELCDVYTNFHILADEVYHFLSWESSGEKLLPFADYHQNIISIGSFSKILAPSLRLGWIYENKRGLYGNQTNNSVITKLSKLGIYDSTGGTGVLSSYLTEFLIDNGELDKYVKECQNFLGSRSRTICQGLSELRNKGLIEFREPKGGYFVWIKVNDINADELLAESIKNKVKFHPGWKFTSTDDNFTDYIRLSVSYYDEKDLEIGTSRLSKTISEFNKTKVSVLGATGKLGKLIVEEIEKNNELSYIGPINREMDLSKLSNNKCVIIDVSAPEATNLLVEKLLNSNLKVPLIVGTTGNINMSMLMGYSVLAPVAHITNFSDGIPTIMNFSNILNQLPDTWTFNMIEKHHVNKKDSPSGTARTWVESLNRPCETKSIREGEIFGEHELVLSNSNEEIIIKHTAKNRNIFARGSMKYINWIIEQDAGFYDKIDFSKYRQPRIRKYSASGNILIIAEFIKENKWNRFVLDKASEDEKLDGVIFLNRYLNKDTDQMETKWTYFNRDGTQVPFCGNGVRCIGKYLGENYKELTGNIVNPKSLVSTYRTDEDSIYFNSPRPIHINSPTQISKIQDVTTEFEFLNIQGIAMIAVGVPHIVIDCDCNIFEIDNAIIDYLSKAIHTSFSSNFNINFVNVNDENNFQIRTFERGVNRETGSCGSGCIASFYYLFNNTNKVNKNCKAHFKENGSMQVYNDDTNHNSYCLGGHVDKLN